MTTTLITGGNKGLGRETARRLIEEGHTVWIGARDEARGREAAEALGARFVQLDVTDDVSVAAAAETVGALDVLVNNAGIAGNSAPMQEVGPDDVREIYETNVFGVVRVTRAFLPLLEKSAAPVVVNVSSGLASLARAAEGKPVGYPAPAYSSSKTALNMLTLQYAQALPGIRFNAVEPGFTATDLNEHQGVQTVEEGAEAIVAMALIGPDGPTGSFTGRDGVYAW